MEIRMLVKNKTETFLHLDDVIAWLELASKTENLDRMGGELVVDCLLDDLKQIKNREQETKSKKKGWLFW